jgi:hypothetical protein
MPSVRGLLEERERVARQRVDARETVGEVLAEERPGLFGVPVGRDDSS